ncbi:MAG: hypothetical protein RLZZ344_1589 [Pseudomonadota bacterium]|jgi:hypothetical protein
MTGIGLGGLSAYALEVLELTPLWRLRRSLEESAADSIEESSDAPDASTARPRVWWSVSNAPVPAALRNAAEQAVGLATRPVSASPASLAWRVAQPSDWFTWLGAQGFAQTAASGPGIVLVWGADFTGLSRGQVEKMPVWLLGLPDISQGFTAQARRATWASLLALRGAFR